MCLFSNTIDIDSTQQFDSSKQLHEYQLNKQMSISKQESVTVNCFFAQQLVSFILTLIYTN